MIACGPGLIGTSAYADPGQSATGNQPTAVVEFGVAAPQRDSAQSDSAQSDSAQSERDTDSSQQSATPDVEVTKTTVPQAKSSAVEPEPEVAELTKTDVEPYRMVGVTWAPDTLVYGVQVKLRVRSEGKWSRWRDLEVSEDGDAGGTPGTDPLWVGRADGVAARVTSKVGTPRGVKINTIDPGTSESSASSAEAAIAQSNTKPTMPSAPRIITRSQWGASAGSSCDSPRVGPTTKGAVVHHTAGSNSYSARQAASLVRGVQAYHTKSRGWCDIGYNFLVDKYGQVFEGRKGGMDRNVRAAHSGSGAVNSNTMGVTLMGNFDKARPTAAMKTSTVKLIGWRMGRTYRPATGTYSLSGYKLHRIAGHRDVVGTACPGRYGYAWLSASGGLRDRVKKYLSGVRSSNKSRAASLGDSRTGQVYIGEQAVSRSAQQTRFSKLDLYATSRTGSHTIAGTFRRAYNKHGSARLSTLGYPTGDSPTSRSGVTKQSMSGGGIYAVPKRGTYAVWGRTYKAYAKAGGRGRLGAPLSTIGPVKNGKRVTTLQAGRVVFDLRTAVATAYDSAGRKLATSGAAQASPAPSSSAGNTKAVPSSRTFTVYGRGYGHGIGMGQYGAEAAARKGKKYSEILAHYYRGTTLSTTKGRLRVLISADTTDGVLVKAQSGLKLYDIAADRSRTLPTSVNGTKVDRYEIVRTKGSASRSKLRYRTVGGSYRDFRVNSKILTWGGDAQFYTSSTVSLILPDGSVMRLRGAVRSAKPSPGSGKRDTINSLPLDSYVRGVVAAEMPSSWSAEALKAQAVAARTYAVRSRNSSRYYDICSTTACQVYGGVARETAATDRAVAGTSKRILTYRGSAAFTQFSSSTGGYSATGSAPYLKAVSDSWDRWSGNPNRSWKVSVKASAVESRYSLGKLKSLSVVKRNGKGDWGGRVVSIKLVGSARTVTISGDDARWAFGLKSNWFKF